MIDGIHSVDLKKIDPKQFGQMFSDCIVLTQNHKILLQQRSLNYGASTGCLTAFGGHIEQGETSIQALIRELNEELGAQAKAEDVIELGAITEAFTNHTDLVYGHFWHDKHGSITGCYECEAVEYDSVDAALKHPKIMDYVVWFLKECQTRGLLSL